MSDQLTLNLEVALELAVEDVETQREIDRRPARELEFADPRPPSITLIRARMRGVLRASAHPDEPYAYRQALVDLSAVCAELAATLPRPRVPARTWPDRSARSKS